MRCVHVKKAAIAFKGAAIVKADNPGGPGGPAGPPWAPLQDPLGTLGPPVGGWGFACGARDLACGGLVKILDGGGPKFFENCRNIFLKIFRGNF